MSDKRPIISLIAAMTPQRVIGIENSLPWKLPADMKWFRQHTLGKPIVMGRKTYESFGARPLPQRLNIVVTHDKNYNPGQHDNEVKVVHSIDEAIQAAGEVEELMIIGGASFYEQALPMAERMYLTEVQTEVKGDAWFPEFDASVWNQVDSQRHEVDEKNAHAMEFKILQRK